MALKKFDEKSFDEVRAHKGVALVDFYADWCGPCRMLSPIVEAVAREREDVLVAKVNVDDNPALAGEFNVFSIPTLVVLKDGKVVFNQAGVRPKEQILSLLD
jgi:thioredoxin 1